MAERLREKPEKQSQTDGQRDDEEDRRPPGLLLAFSAHALMLAAPHPPLRGTFSPRGGEKALESPLPRERERVARSAG